MNDTVSTLQLITAIVDCYYRLEQVDTALDKLSQLIRLEMKRIYLEEKGRPAEYEPWIKQAQRMLLSYMDE